MSNLRSVSKKGQLNQALAVLNKIGQTLISTQDLSVTLKKIVQNARDVLRADIVDLYEYIQNNNEFVLPPILVGKRRHRHVPKVKIYNDDVVMKVVKAGKPKYFPDAQTATLLTGKFNVKRDDAPDKRFVTREGVLSSVSIPLQAGRETVGVMFVNYRTKQPFDDDQRNLIESFSNLAAIAIYNARLYKAEHDRRQLSDFQTQALDRLSRLSQRLVSIREEHENVSGLLIEVAQSAKEVLRADIIELYEYSHVKRSYQLPQISVGERIGPFVAKQEIYDDDSVLQLIDRDQPSYIENSQVDDSIASDYTFVRADRPTERFAIREKIQSTAAIPLKAGDEPVGLMFANYRTRQEFTDEQKELIELFANQAAIAIQNARLYRDMDVQVNERTLQLEDVNRRLETLVSFGRTLTSGIRLKEDGILNLIHKQASELMDTQNMYVALYDSNNDEVRFGLIFKNGERINVPPRKAGSGRTEEIIRTQKPIFIATREESVEWYKKLDREEYIGDPFASWIGVPMMSEDSVLGVIATYHPTKDNVYNHDDLKILQGIADQATIAIDNARLYYEVNADLMAKKYELERLNSEKDEELLASRQKISQAEQMIVINSFTMDILHRVPNLVGTIPLRADTIIRRLKENGVKDDMERIITQVEGIKRDADTLLDSVKKWNPYEEALKKLPEDVGLLLNSALRNTLIPENVEIETNFAEDMACVLCNPKELFESFRCIIENSFQAMASSLLGKLSIRTSVNTDQGQKWIDVKIMDTGHGVSPENLPKVFELGFTTKDNGMGYGLWRARAVIEKIGGKISIESVVNKGTTFDIRLPVLEGEVCDD
jgi:GAF domain-containing protein